MASQRASVSELKRWALDESDVAMAEREEVVDGERGRTMVVENNVGYPLRLMVAGDGDGGDAGAAGERCVDGDEAVDGALQQHLLAALDHLGLVVVADEEVDIVGLVQALLDTAENQRGVAFADLRRHYTDGHALLFAQGAGEYVGPIVHRGGGGKDAFLCDLGDGLGGGCAAEDTGDRGDG